MDEHPTQPEPLVHRLSRLKWLWFLILVLLAAGAYLYWPKTKSAASINPSKDGARKSNDGTRKSNDGGRKSNDGAQKKKGGRGGEPPIIPVVGARAQKGN